MIESIVSLLRCPLCGGAFLKRDNSLVCEKRHTYDIARQGYVNFVPGQRTTFYKKELFDHRAQTFAAGVYAPVVARLTEMIDRYAGNPVLLDAGCGEGYYTKAVCPGRQMTRIGFDLSKDAVRLAARGRSDAAFFVADLKHIPMCNHTAGVLLDVFTPADYAEFGRVLAPDGVVVKLAPRGGYLRELRTLAGGQLRHASYDDSDVERYVHERMDVLHQEAVTYTLAVSGQTAQHLARMTPMLAGIDVDGLDLSGVSEITIDETLYVGRVRRDIRTTDGEDRT